MAQPLVRERELRAWMFACAGKTQAFIAQELGITQGAVCQILARVGKRALKALEADVEQRKALHTARLEHIYSEAMDAWAESKKPQKKSRRRKTVVPGTSASETDLANAVAGRPIVGRSDLTLREERLDEAVTSEGNFLMLQTALQADGELRKLWGLNAAKKIDLLDQRRPLEKLTDEELARRLAENAELLAAGGAR